MLFALSFILLILVLNGGGVEVKEEIYLATCDFPHPCFVGMVCHRLSSVAFSSPQQSQPLPFSPSPFRSILHYPPKETFKTTFIYTHWHSIQNFEALIRMWMVCTGEWWRREGEGITCSCATINSNLSNDRRSTRSQHFIHPDPPLYLDTNPARGQCCNPHWCQGMLISTLKGVNYTPQLVIN